jgi:hypothetical protein
VICESCADMADWQDGRGGAIRAMAAVGHGLFCDGPGRCDCQHRARVQPSRYEMLSELRARRRT